MFSYSHAHGETFSWRGIELVVDYFKDRGFKECEIIIIVPEWRARQRHLKYREKNIVRKLKGEGMIEFSPPYTYDDRFDFHLVYK